jgi:hypothetical protein
MKRTTKLIVAAGVLAATITGVAVAASSPTVATGRATRIGNFGATLNATINPNGSATAYVFLYGLTNQYGLSTVSQSAGHGNRPVAVAAGIGDLQPGTVYHYRVQALNRSGAAYGADRTLTTTGPPPAGVVTGPAVNVGKTTATLTGTVDTNGATTVWAVQYGINPNLGVQTFGQVLQASPTPTPVAVTLGGLTPKTTFYYRLVGYHGTRVVSYGGTATFFTEPNKRPTPRVSAHTTPSRATHRPYVFTTLGAVHGPSWIPAAAQCSGDVGLRYFHGGRQIGFVLVPVGATCQFAGQAAFNHVRGRGPRPVTIKVYFRGNGYLYKASHIDHVTVG